MSFNFSHCLDILCWMKIILKSIINNIHRIYSFLLLILFIHRSFVFFFFKRTRDTTITYVHYPSCHMTVPFPFQSLYSTHNIRFSGHTSHLCYFLHISIFHTQNFHIQREIFTEMFSPRKIIKSLEIIKPKTRPT